ncbi:hypothetical protein V6N13_124895 [Hibiscus sabdariffa]|uniref:TF-B3 domain-containing protein n=1 Tax=Hibiscus sabdariffa TaxID=183260 RepID=A0ABR2U4I8_9ROSI
MASPYGRGNNRSPKPYHFFKVILESTIRDGKLAIPCKFARDYFNTLSSPVFFEFPNGEVWELELTKLEDEMWVQNGWRKLAEHYSLELGHFLVFRYEGNCRFHVLIFDTSASEIHYPYTNGKEGIHQQQVKIEESEEDDSVQIINNFSTCMRKKLALQCSRPLKIMRACNNGFSAGKGKVKKVKSDEKSKALMRASSAFQSENPFFLVFMQPTYVGFDSRRSCYICIPKEFSRKYLVGHGDVILSDSNGKTWSAEYHYILGSKRPCVLCNGWEAFVRDHELQVGDVCIFELIDCIDISFKVFIYGGNHGSSEKMDAGISSTHQECLEPLKVHEALALPSDESPKVDDNQLGTSRPQTREDGLNSEKKEYNAYPESNTLLFSKNKTMFEKGEPTKIRHDVISSRGCPRVGSKPRVTPLSSPLLPSSSLGRSSRGAGGCFRLQNTTPVTYSEAALAKKYELLQDVQLKLSKSKVHTEEHEKLLGNTERSWKLSVDGYGSDRRQSYDSFKGKTCHQCWHGEHVLEANEKPKWVCPVYPGICNCSFCRQAKGLAPTGPLYTKISKGSPPSSTLGAHTDMEKNLDNTDQASAKRSLSFPTPELRPEDSGEVHDNQLVTSEPQTGEDGFNSERKEYNAYRESNTLLFSMNETVFEKGEPTEISLNVHGKLGFSEPDSGEKRDDGKELKFTNKEPGGTHVTSKSIPKKKRAFSTEPTLDSIAARVRQRRGKGSGVNAEVLDDSGKNVDEGCTATESSRKLMKRSASAMENGLNSNAARPKQSRVLGNDHDKPGLPGASGEESNTNMKHSTCGTNMDCIARRLRPRRKAL